MPAKSSKRFEILRRRRQIAELYVQRHSQATIAERLGSVRPPSRRTSSEFAASGGSQRDVRRGRWSPAERDDRILRTAKVDGYGVQIVLEQEPGSAGKSVTDYLGRRLVGHIIAADRPTGSKEVRAQPLAGQCGIGNVCLVKGEWNAAYLDELGIFPNGRYDDQVDASSGAFARLTRFAIAFSPPTAIYPGPRNRGLFGAPFNHTVARAMRYRHRQTDRS